MGVAWRGMAWHGIFISKGAAAAKRDSAELLQIVRCREVLQAVSTHLLRRRLVGTAVDTRAWRLFCYRTRRPVLVVRGTLAPVVLCLSVPVPDELD